MFAWRAAFGSAALGLAAFGLAAFGLAAVGGVLTPATALAAPATVTITAGNGPKEGDEQAIRLMQAKIARFNAKYPNIRVITDPWEYDPASFAIKFAGRKEPDLIGIPATEMKAIAEAGYAADITDLVKQWHWANQIQPGFLEAATVDGRIYGIPTHGYVMGLTYNKRLFREAGLGNGDDSKPGPIQTWDDLLTAAKKLTNRQKNQAGLGIMGASAQGGWQMLNYIWQAGGDVERKVNGKWMAVFNEPEAVKAFQFIRDLRWKHDVFQRNVLVNAEAMFPMFATGRVAMFLGTPEWVPIIVNKYGGNVEDIGLTTLPAGPGGRANQMGGIYVFISAHVTDKQKLEAAFRWQTFEFELEEREAMAKTARELGKLVGVPEFLLFKEQAQAQFEAVIDKYRNFPKYEYYSQNAPKYARPEPPYAAQQLYLELEAVLQAVLTDPYANIQKLLNERAAAFQKRFLDPVNSGKK